MPTQKNFDQLLIFVNLYQHAKNQFIPSLHSSDTVNFKVHSHDWPHPLLTMPTPETFKLIFMILYQHAESSHQIGHAKNETVSLTCSGEIVHLEILQSDWPISQEQSQALCRNTANKNFQYKINIILHFPLKSKNPIFDDFLPISPNFWAQKVFP